MACGTYYSFMYHYRHDEPIDAACRQAKRDYDRHIRARNAPKNWARKDAIEQLIENHHAEFDQLLIEALSRY